MKVNKCFVRIFENISSKLRNTQVYSIFQHTRETRKHTPNAQNIKKFKIVEKTKISVPL